MGFSITRSSLLISKVTVKDGPVVAPDGQWPSMFAFGGAEHSPPVLRNTQRDIWEASGSVLIFFPGSRIQGKIQNLQLRTKRCPQGTREPLQRRMVGRDPSQRWTHLSCILAWAMLKATSPISLSCFQATRALGLVLLWTFISKAREVVEACQTRIKNDKRADYITGDKNEK